MSSFVSKININRVDTYKSIQLYFVQLNRSSTWENHDKMLVDMG